MKKAPLRRAPRRRDIERLEERQMLSVSGGGGGSGGGISFTNDVLAGAQWHLLANGQLVAQPNAPEYNQTIAAFGEDINVLNAWAQNITGKGIQIGILAGGFDLLHEDLENFRIDLGIDFVDNDSDPTFVDLNDFEGTALAGLIGATANNNLGVVGVAFDSDLVPIRIDVDGNDPTVVSVDDYVRAFTYLAGFANDLDQDGNLDPITQSETIEIYVHAWDDDTQSNTSGEIRIDPLIQNALRTSVTLGRPFWDDADGDGILTESEWESYKALGSIHIVPTGNLNGPGTDVAFQDIGVFQSAIYNELANSRFTIAVGSVDHGGNYENLETGTVTSWPSISPATLIVAPAGSSGINGLEITSGVDGGSALWTTDITGDAGRNSSPVFGFEADGDFLQDINYTSKFSDTSGAAAQVAGAVALMLEANPGLTYREVQYILMASARQNDQFSETWITNSLTFFQDDYEAPLWYSYDFDTNDDGAVDIENGIIPNFETDVDTGFSVAIRNFFAGSLGFGALTGVTDFNLPFNPNNLLDTTGLLTNQIDPMADPADVQETLTIIGSDTPLIDPMAEDPQHPIDFYDPKPIQLFPQGTAEALTDAKVGLLSLLRPSSANTPELQFENGAGFTVSAGYGSYLEEIGYAHGVLDVTLAVEMAQKWDEFGFTLPEEVSLTTGIQGGNFTPLRIQPRADMDLGDGDGTFIIPGARDDSGTIDTAFFEEFLTGFAAEEVELFDTNGNSVGIGEILTEAPFFDPDGDDNFDPPRPTNVIPIPLEQGIIDNFLTTEWVEFRTNVVAGSIDQLRVTLVSPDGTHTELTPYRLPAGTPGDSVFQVGQDFQGSVYPNSNDIIAQGVGGGVNPFPDQINGSEEQIIVGVTLGANPVSAGEAWTWTTNRHWGEIVSVQTNNEDGGGVGQPWEIIVENWGASEVSIGQYEVAFHGYESTGSRIQGKIGVDDNKQNIDGIDNDENFNFDRFLTFGQVNTGSEIVSVVLDDAFDSVRHGNVHETRDPDTGEEHRYAVIDQADYVDATSIDPTVKDPAIARIVNRLIAAQIDQPLLGFVIQPGDPVAVLQESFGAGDFSSTGAPVTMQNFDFSQESFELGVTVVSTQFRVDHAPRTQSGVVDAPLAAVSTGVTQQFLTGADGNYFFDVEATPKPPTVEEHTVDEVFNEAAFNADYDNWFNDFGGVTFEYKITLENVDEARRIDSSYTSTPSRGSIAYSSAELGYMVEMFASNLVQQGETSVTKDVNFLLKIDPADTNVEVAGTVFLDFDSDGVVDTFDTPTAGVTVFYDADSSGTVTAGDVSTTTGADGTYTLTIAGLPAEQSVDVLIDQSTIPVGLETQDPLSGSRTLTATPGEGVSASFTLQPIGGIGGIINGSVFNDLNENGAIDTGETGVPESQLVRVYVDLNGNGLYDADPDSNPATDDAEPSTLTGTDGAFTISSQTEGTFDVRVDLVGQHFRQTTPLADAGISVSILAGQVTSNLLFGLFDTNTQDFGDLFVDATHNYPTLAIDDGARHTVVAGFFLGSSVDIDEDGQTSTTGLGDDLSDGNDDEDGVVLVSSQILPNSTITFDITATGAGGSLNAWIDFNNDGDWNDPGEQIAVDAGLASGQTNRRSFATPSDVDVSADFLAARFRWGPFGLSYTGAANSGEVEDYLLPTTPQVAIGGQIVVDANDDGIQDAGDTPAAGVVVFFDANQDGIKNLSELSTTTNAGGTYNISIPAVSTFDLTLRVDASTLPSGVSFLSPPDGIFARTVSPGEVITSDFLLAPEDQLPQGVAGSVFEDADNNGAKNGVEAGLAGVLVELYTGFTFDTLVGSAVTDINGNYEIEAPQAGTFEVRLNLGSPTFLTQTTPAGGQQVVVNGGQLVSLADFGVFDQSATFTDDYGDLFVDGSHNFPTLLADNGARHTVVSGVFLGAGVDRDPGTLTSSDATADDLSSTDDEDGVTLFSKDINPNSTIEIDVKATGIGATLDAWIDFNDDGDWDDAGERITTNLALTSGATTRIQVTTPADVSVTAASLAARFRWGFGTVGYAGQLASGEVEDYLLPTHSPTGNSIAGDANGDGTVDLLDLDILGSNFSTSPATFAQGDFNGDNVVDLLDLDILGASFGVAAVSTANSNGDDTVSPDPLANAPTSSSFAFFTQDPDYVVTVPQIAESAPQFTSPSFVEKAPEAPAVSAAPVALMLSSAVDNALAVEGPIQQAATPTTGSDAIEQALLEWAIQGPVAADASDEVIATIFGGDSDESDESIELALADEVFAL